MFTKTISINSTAGKSFNATVNQDTIYPIVEFTSDKGAILQTYSGDTLLFGWPMGDDLRVGPLMLIGSDPDTIIPSNEMLLVAGIIVQCMEYQIKNK